MSTAPTASAAAREQREADELFRGASAAMAFTTHVKSIEGGGGGGQYDSLTHYEVAHEKRWWYDIDDEEADAILENVERRLEERRDAVAAEDAKRDAKANKRNRRDEVDELAEAIAGGGAVGGNSGKLRARDANVPSEAPAATGSDAKRARVDGAGRGTALEKEVVGTAGDGESEVSVIQVPEYSSNELESGLDMAKENRQRREHGEEDAPGEEDAYGEEDAREEKASKSSSRRCFADVRVRDDADSATLRVVKLTPCAWDPVWNSVSEFQAVVEDANGDRWEGRFAASRNATMVLEDQHEGTARYRGAEFLMQQQGKLEFRAVAANGAKMADGIKIASKTIRWTTEDKVSEIPTASAAVILCKSEDVERCVQARMEHFAQFFPVGDSKRMYPVFQVVDREEEVGCRHFKVRSWSDGIVQRRVRDGIIGAADQDVWRDFVKRASAYFVYDVQTYVLERRSKSTLPPALTSGPEALRLAEQWKALQQSAVSRTLSSDVSTLGQAWMCMLRSPGPGDRPGKDGAWREKLYNRNRVTLQDRESDGRGEETTTTMCNEYDARLLVARANGCTGTWTLVPLSEIVPGCAIATAIDNEGRPIRFRWVRHVFHSTSFENIEFKPSNLRRRDGVDDALGFICTSSTTLVNCAPACYQRRRWSDAVVQDFSFVEYPNRPGRLKQQSVTVTVDATRSATVEEAMAKARRFKDAHLGACEIRPTRDAVHVEQDAVSVAVFRFGAASMSSLFVETHDDVDAVFARVPAVTYVTTTAKQAMEDERYAAHRFESMQNLHDQARQRGANPEVATGAFSKTLGAYYLNGETRLAVPSCPMMRDEGVPLLPDTFPLELRENPYLLEIFWHMVGLWLGDGDARRTAVTVADDEPEIMEKMREFAEMIDAEISVKPASDGGRCSTVYIRKSRSNYFGRALVSLDLMPGKEITTTTLAILLAQPKSCRLHFIAGLTDSDGSKCLETVFGVRAYSLVQSVQNTATSHVGILTAYAVVAQSLGMDARREEGFAFASKVLFDDNGQVLRGVHRAENARERLNFAREKYGNVLISGGATAEIPLWVSSKRLRQTQRFDDHSVGFNAMNAIPAASIGVYELKSVQSPLAMVRLEFCEDDDARGPDVFALAKNGFLVLA